MKLKYELKTMALGDRLIAVPLNSDHEFCGVLHINETTSDILNILSTDVTKQELIALMFQKYDASEADIIRNIDKVLSILKKYNLLID